MRNIERIEAALHAIPADARETWLRMGMAVKSELGEAGFEVWNTWSQSSMAYRANDAHTVWQSIKPEGGVTIATLFHDAKVHGWQDTRHEVFPLSSPMCLHGTKENPQSETVKHTTAQNARALWEAGEPARPDHPYLVKKRVSPVDALREIDTKEASTFLGYVPKSGNTPLTGRLLVVPVKVGERLSTVELIDEAGHKTALKGKGTKTSGFWATSPLPSDDGGGGTLLIGEGVATALSVNAATGYPAIAALSCHNLTPVANAMRECYPNATLVILADVVKTTSESTRHAIKAACACQGRLAIPHFGPHRPQGATDFNDMATLMGEGAVERAIKEILSAPCGLSDTTPWPEPQSLIDQVTSAPYPMDALPPVIREAVEEVRAFVQAPAAMVASSALGAVSLAIQAHIDVQRAPSLQSPTSLYFLTIADSGERKTTCDNYFIQAIRDYETEQESASEPAMRKHLADLGTWEAKNKGIKDKIRQLAKEGKPTETQESTLHDLEDCRPEPPRVPRLIYVDATPEALKWHLAKAWPTGGIVSSEGGLVLGGHAMGKDANMRHFATLNQLWDGKAIATERRTSESFTVRGARLSIALQVQAPTLHHFCYQSGALARGTGFFARFLIAWPESTQGQRFYQDPPNDWPALEQFHHRLRAILNADVPIQDNGTLSPLTLPFTPEAKAAWIACHDAIECELAQGGTLCDVRDVASKAADNVARLAALFHGLEHGMEGAIGVACVVSAQRIIHWHLNESRRFFNELALPEDLINAHRLDAWLIAYGRQHGTDTVPRRDALRDCLREEKKLAPALSQLEDLDRVRQRSDGRRKLILLNPGLLGDTP